MCLFQKIAYKIIIVVKLAHEGKIENIPVLVISAEAKYPFEKVSPLIFLERLHKKSTAVLSL